MMSPRLFAALLILVQCYIFIGLSGAVFAGMSCATLAIVAIGVSVPMKLWQQASLVIFAIAAISYWFCGLSLDVENDWLVPANFVSAASLLGICVQLTLLFATSCEQPVPQAFVGTALVSFLLAFCRTETSSNQLYFYCVSVAMALLLACLTSSQSTERQQRKARFTMPRLRLPIYVFVSVAMGTAYFASSAKEATAILRLMVTQKVNDYVAAENAVVAFTADGNLGSVASLKQHLPEKVVLDVRCDTEPGYLRGRVFDHFEGRRWSLLDDRVRHPRKALDPVNVTQIPELAQLSENVGLNVIEIEKGNVRSLRCVSVTNRKSLIGNVYFTPLNIDYFLSVGKSLELDNAIVVRKASSPRRSYQSFVSRFRAEKPLSSAEQRLLTRVDDRLRNELAEAGNQIFENAQTTLEKVKRIESFFSTKQPVLPWRFRLVVRQTSCHRLCFKSTKRAL